MFAAPEALRNDDVHHEYRQESDFFYLTGLEEPECVCVLRAGESPRYTLFLRERDRSRETWDGPRLGVEGAKEQLGADDAFPIAELDKRLPGLLAGHRRLHYRFGVRDEHDRRLLAALVRARALGRRGQGAPSEIIDTAETVHRLRWQKSAEDLLAMRRAIDISAEAHRAAMRVTRAGRYEYELEAELRHVFRREGSRRAAYPPIVGSGPNATILHHVQNDRQLRAGELVLIDAGCEFDYFAADITRTFPVSGRFSEPQRRCYEVVLAAQHAAFAAVAPGATLKSVHDAAVGVLVDGLCELGLVQGPPKEALEQERYKPFYMHRTGHYLGMDVHDCAPPEAFREPLPMTPGVVITVEPGLYIAPDQPDVPAEYRGIGIRIEDDVLVTESGYENLSAALPTQAAEIEALVGTGSV